MPKAGGLPDVTQRIDLDASGYTRGSDEMVQAALKMAQENRETLRTFGDMHVGLGGLKADILDMRDNFERYIAVQREVLNVQKEMKDAQDDMHSAFGNSNDVMRMHADQLNDLYDKYGDIGLATGQATAGQHELALAHLEQMSALDRLVSRYGVAEEATRSLMRAKQEHAAVIAKEFELGQQTEVMHDRIGDSALRSSEAIVASVARAKAANAEMTSIVAGVTAAQAAGLAATKSLLTGKGGGVDGGSGTIDNAIARAMGGGGGGGWAAAAAMAADSGGGRNAASAWRPVGAFLGTWLPRAHYVLMAANELAATLGPAIVAGGMGALVGVQGGEQAVPRLKAIFATGEALGDSLGQTQGQFMGLKVPALQNAQDLATGAAFEGIGAMTNILKAGAGGSFISLGQNTVSMWSRMMANITTEFQHGLGDQLGGVVSGGTGYLSQFGQIFGNLGHTFLNAAPNLPGLGGDYLSILQGGTKGLSALTGWLGPSLGPLLAAEAGGRIGTPFVGGVASLLKGVGGKVAGFGDTLGAGTISGLSAADAAAIAGETVVGLGASEGGSLLSRLLGRGGVGLAKAGGALGAATAPQIAVTAAMAYMLTKGVTYQDPYQQHANALMSQINNMGIPGDVPSIIGAMQGFAKVPYDTTSNKGAGAAVNYDLSNLFKTGSSVFKPQGQGWGFHPGGLATGIEAGIGGFWHEIFGGTTGPTNYEVAQQKLQQLSEGLVNTFGAGAQVEHQWKKLSGGAIDMGKAFDVATMAQLQLGTSFEKNGKLTAQAKQMIANLYAGYAPMNMNSGQFGTAVAAQTAMSGLQHTQLAAVNTAYDQLTQLVSSGPSGAAALSGLIAKMPAGAGKAMKGYLSPASSAAWTAFASTTQPSVIAQLQSQTDYLREAQTMGALGPGQSKSMTEFLLGQALPSAKGSPAALAMLSMIGQQAGGPAFAPGTSAAKMYSQLEKFAKQGGGAGQFTAGMTQSTEMMANIGRDAQQFVQQIGSGIGGALAQGIANHGATLQGAFMNSIGKGGFSGAALGKYGQFLSASGVPLKGQQDMISYAAKLSGATPHQINAMMAQIKKEYTIYIKTQADLSKAAALKALLASIHSKSVEAKAGAHYSEVQQLNAEMRKMHDKLVHAKALGDSSQVAALNAQINALHNKTVTVTTQMISVYGMGISRGIPAGVRAPGYSTGTLVPGFGSGDHVPALLEPGEAIVPRYLVPLIAPILKSHHVPGFAAGGIVPAGTLAGVNSQISSEWKILDALYAQKDAGKNVKAQIAAFWKDILDPLYAAKDAFKNMSKHAAATATHVSAATKAAQALATSITNKFANAMNFARGVSGAFSAGQGFGNAGLITGMDPTQKPVVNQMQDYLKSEQDFGKDLKTLTKGGLNKSLIQQLIAAGPVQGDLLAQSILQGGGTSGPNSGIGQVNSLWKQIGVQSHALGAQAAMAIYGQTIAPNLKSGTITSNNISINVNVPSGAGANLALSTAQINAIVAAVQAALLKQAKRNRTTGVALAGKKA